MKAIAITALFAAVIAGAAFGGAKSTARHNSYPATDTECEQHQAHLVGEAIETMRNGADFRLYIVVNTAGMTSESKQEVYDEADTSRLTPIFVREDEIVFFNLESEEYEEREHGNACR